MSATDIWPFDLLSPLTPRWSPSTTVNSGGTTLSGLEQRDRVDGGPLWECALRGIPVWNGRQILAHDALEMILVGDLSPIIVQRRPPKCDTLGGEVGDGVPHSDESPFSDDSLYESGGSVTSSATGAADLGDTEIELTVTGTLRPLLGGDEFTIVHPIAKERMYRIKRVTAVAGDTYTVEFGPPLRDDVDAGEALDFNDPRCLMRLDDADAFKLELENNERGQFDAVFTEAYW